MSLSNYGFIGVSAVIACWNVLGNAADIIHDSLLFSATYNVETTTTDDLREAGITQVHCIEPSALLGSMIESSGKLSEFYYVTTKDAFNGTMLQGSIRNEDGTMSLGLQHCVGDGLGRTLSHITRTL